MRTKRRRKEGEIDKKTKIREKEKKGGGEEE